VLSQSAFCFSAGVQDDNLATMISNSLVHFLETGYRLGRSIIGRTYLSGIRTMAIIHRDIKRTI